jgi:hypothetical protein
LPETGGSPIGEDARQCNSLPSNLPNAWDEKCAEPCAVYMSVGYMAMMRQRPENQVAAVFDQLGGGFDSGAQTPPNSPIALNYHDIDPRMNHGVRAMIGYHWDTCAIEASGFYLAQSSSSRVAAVPNGLDTFFNVNGDVTTFPLGFEGNNGMWLQADVMRLNLKTALASGEVNWRWWLGECSNFSWSLGVRYLDLYERFSFYTGDDDLTVIGANGLPDPTREATYSTTAHNHILAPQLGLEWNQACCCWLAFTLKAKGAWGINFLDVDTTLFRGDDFTAFHGHRTEYTFSMVYEAGLFFDISLWERGRLRVGYDVLWAVDVADAINQLNFNLADTAALGGNNHDSIFYHGPVVELHILF